MEKRELEKELLNLDPEDQDRIAAMLTLVRRKREGREHEPRERLDRPETQWIDYSQVREELYSLD